MAKRCRLDRCLPVTVNRRSAWQDAPWFALPPSRADLPTDLRLHVTRSGAGNLNLDATLSHAEQDGVQDLLIDVAGQRP